MNNKIKNNKVHIEKIVVNTYLLNRNTLYFSTHKRKIIDKKIKEKYPKLKNSARGVPCLQIRKGVNILSGA